ncbi:FkbM family methyltransferase [Haloarcula salinisoli]|uniref:FkbM family methyltransferase n=1 Tax=Haloarcula salinisoli TaxID=2487746 RepID=A0A8J8CC07_9EURY|nr:FkbM family methyltransferase [Halomicroarcula salinisoli]MBX0305053.1 FkbM family methyltransferase [Halomicroarcula salinisoli]
MGEREVLETLVSEVRSDDTVWDIGGSWGMFTTPLAATGADVSVFEPVPDRANKIKRNLSQNDLSATINQFALGAERKELTVAIEGKNPGGLTESDGAIQTAVRPGDSVVNESRIEVPTVLKIDVEGAEVDVLKGLSQILARPECRLLVIEVHRDLLGQFRATESELYELLDGFNVETLSQRNDENYHLIAKRET